MAAAFPIVFRGRATVPGFESDPPVETYRAPFTGAGGLVASGVGAGVAADVAAGQGEDVAVTGAALGPGVTDAAPTDDGVASAAGLDAAADEAFADAAGDSCTGWEGDRTGVADGATDVAAIGAAGPASPCGVVASNSGTSATNASVDPTMATRTAVALLTPARSAGE
jgi:hypothetical protein